MKFREWDPGTGGAKGISDHHYGCLEPNRKGFKGSDTTDTIEIRRDLGNNGKLGIVGFWYLLRASSRVCFFEVWSIVFQLRNLQRVILNQKGEVVGLEIKEKNYRSALLRLWKVLIVWLIHTYHDGVGLLREEICGINQIIWHLIGLDWWRGVEEIRLVYIKRIDTEVYIILSISSSINSLFHLEVFGVSGLLVVMSQSQLLGKSGDLKNAEGTRKRLKISVPHFDNTELIKQYDKTLIGRCMNPAAQDVKALIVMLPKIWKVEAHVAGTDLGLGKFQFDFVEEEDIETVLKSQPFHFDYRMVVLARWQPKMPRDFPAAIPFWIKIMGVPLEFWDAPTFQSIGDALGETVEVDLDYGRIKVIIDTTKELSFDTTVDFIGGEFHEGDEAFISLKYEKLFGFCETCLSLSHSVDYCPLTVNSPQKKKEVR